MNPSPSRPAEAGRWPAAVAAVIEEAAAMTPLEIVELARRHLHEHPPGPCPSAPLRSCRREAVDRIEAVIRTATGRADAERQVRAIRAEVEQALHAAAGPMLLRAEPVLGAVSAAADAATAAAVAAFLPERLSTETVMLLSTTWRSLRPSGTGGTA